MKTDTKDHNLGKLIDKYVLCKKIGEGAFAKVYLAHNKENGKKYACKIINKALAESKGITFDDIKQEVAIMQQINHRNILKLYDFYYTKGENYYLILQLCKDRDFKTLMEKKG